MPPIQFEFAVSFWAGLPEVWLRRLVCGSLVDEALEGASEDGLAEYTFHR
jgi:hypothetical protein